MAAFTQQKLQWRTCDQAFVGEELWEQHGDDFKSVGNRAQCALMRAPLDYANPALGELQVALSRVAAEQPRQRLGAIFFNPGGPGAEGLGHGAHFGSQWSAVDADDEASMLLKQMSERYDLIGFSPRGLGGGTALDCGATVPADYTFYDRSPQNLLELQGAVRLQAQACIDNPLSKHINTDATARDMELMRVLLGDEKLNFIGYSYGTWLGGWYASLFPERVGRMLLDSSTNLLASFEDTFLLQEMGKQRLLDDTFLPYATRHPEFNLGESVAELRSALVALSPKLKHLLLFAEDDEGYPQAVDWGDAQSIDHNLLYINAALGLQSLLAQQPAADEGQIRVAIKAHRFASIPHINELAVEYADQLAAKLFETPAQSGRKFPVYRAVQLSVTCNDTGTSGNAQHWIDVGNEYAARYPLTGGEAMAQNCIYWPKSRIQRPPLATAQKAGPILMLQSRHDALTPLEGAQATLDALPNASMIVVENEFQHGVFPYGDKCVDAQVAKYFLHGTLPQRVSTCPGKPLNFDVEDDEDEDDDG